MSTSDIYLSRSDYVESVLEEFHQLMQDCDSLAPLTGDPGDNDKWSLNYLNRAFSEAVRRVRVEVMQ